MVIIYFISCSAHPSIFQLVLESLRVWFQQIGYLSPDRRRALILLIRSPTAPSKSAIQACLKAEHVDLPKSRNRHNDDDSGARRTAPKKPQPLRGVYFLSSVRGFQARVTCKLVISVFGG